MACHTPVIGVPVGAAPELLAEGNGMLVPPESPQAMADAMVNLQTKLSSTRPILGKDATEEQIKEYREALGIPDDLDETSKELWEAADRQGESEIPWERFGIESFSCVCLMKGCEQSIAHSAALVFC